MAGAETAQDWSRLARGLERLLPVWRLLSSGGFALALIGFLALAGLLSIMLPQVPAPIRDSPAAVEAWVEFQRGKFGPLAEPMHRLGLFSVFSARWFLGTLVMLAVSVSIYTASRLPHIWRNVASPQEQVPDAFFDRAANRATFATAEPIAGGDTASRLAAVLRRRRFSVRSFRAEGATYLFADRFAWAQLGSFASHLAIILFLAGGFISQLGGYTNALFIAEGTTNPVFPVSHPKQMQVEVVNAVGDFDEAGLPVDYRTELVIYQGGREVERGVVTVNKPLSYGGYRFHQAGYFGEGADLRVLDAATGNTVYREVLPLQALIPAPTITIRDRQGAVLLDDVIVPTDFIEGASGTLITVPEDGRQFWVGVKQDENEAWTLAVLGRDEPDVSFVLAAGESRQAGDLEFTFVEAMGLPSITTPGIPGDHPQSVVIMSETPEGTAYLTVLGAVDGRALTLYPNQSVQIGDKEYRFEGRREFAGIEVRRDPGATLIWVAAGLLLAGLLVTFYVPRLRLWARVRSQETVIAGPAERGGAFQSEARRLAWELGVRTVENKQEVDEDG